MSFTFQLELKGALSCLIYFLQKAIRLITSANRISKRLHRRFFPLMRDRPLKRPGRFLDNGEGAKHQRFVPLADIFKPEADPSVLSEYYTNAIFDNVGFQSIRPIAVLDNPAEEEVCESVFFTKKNRR